MTDDMKRMVRAFEALDPIEPPADAKSRAFADALTHYDRISEAESQGSRLLNRQSRQNDGSSVVSKWRRIMTFDQPRLSHMLAGGVSLAAIALVAVNTNLIEIKTPPASSGAGAGKKSSSTLLRQSSQQPDDGSSVPAETEPKAANQPVMSDALETKPAHGRELFGANDPARTAAPVTRQEQDVSLDEMAAQSTTVGGQMVRTKTELRTAGKLVAGERVRRDLSKDTVAPSYQDQGRDKFSTQTPNPVKIVRSDPVSTFSIDVDTASYSFTRSTLNRGILPQMDAVRVEEMVNYFDYDYLGPDRRETPFRANISIMPTPWNEDTRLMRVGIKGYELPKADAPRANLVFLIDTSGSMNSPDKLPLLVNSFKLLLSTLKPDDKVSIVTYAGGAGTVLEPTRASQRRTILAALERLHAGGSTAGAEGIRQAYYLADQELDPEGINRVILATDGDFNVGITDIEELKGFVERKRKGGVTLSVLGFGHGNYNDELMQALAQNGNGNAAYIDTLNEARKILVEEAGSTLFTIAKDVKLQIEFNPETVQEYRLIGYESRILNREDFNNDKVDAGDIGAGHTVTALYEFLPVNIEGGLVDPLRYQSEPAPIKARLGEEYGFMKIRYKLPDQDKSQLITAPILTAGATDSVAGASDDMRFAASVAAFGQILRGGRHTGNFTFADIANLARSAKGDDPFGYRAEFINLVQLAQSAADLEPQKR